MSRYPTGLRNIRLPEEVERLNIMAGSSAPIEKCQLEMPGHGGDEDQLMTTPSPSAAWRDALTRRNSPLEPLKFRKYMHRRESHG